MGGGGGTTTSVQDIPPSFRPAFTSLFNSAFGGARQAAGQGDFTFGGGGFGAPGQFLQGTPLQALLGGQGQGGFGQQQQGGFRPGGAFTNPQPTLGGQAQQPPGPGGQFQTPFRQPGTQETSVFGNQPGTRFPGANVGTQPGQQAGTTNFQSPFQATGASAQVLGGENFNQFQRDVSGEDIPLSFGPPIVGQAFPGRFTAPSSPLEAQSLALREQAGLGAINAGGTLGDLGQFTAGGGFLDPSSNPFLQANIEASLQPAIDAFTRSTIPAFQSQAINQGAFGGSSARDFGQAQLANDFGRNLTQTAGQIGFQNFARERGAQERAGQLIDQSIQLQQLAPEILAQTGLGQRELAQRQLDEQLLQFQESINAPFRPLFPLASIIQGSDIGKTFQTNVPTPSPLAGGIAGGLGGAGLGAGISDLLNLSGGQGGALTGGAGLLGLLGGALG